MLKQETGIRKHSAKRDAILDILRGTVIHPGAQWVYEQLKPDMPDLSLGTVYRNLRFFHEEGIILSLGVVNGEERFDGVAEPHPHFICSACGAVLDLPRHRANALCHGLEGILNAEDAFFIDSRRTIFYGLCQRCRFSD
jgi:Fur family peroxide stress response transcriptional regulator